MSTDVELQLCCDFNHIYILSEIRYSQTSERELSYHQTTVPHRLMRAGIAESRPWHADNIMRTAGSRERWTLYVTVSVL